MAVTLPYVDGRLRQASSRGDGLHGSNWTALGQAIGAISTRLPQAPARVVLQGELVWRLSGHVQAATAARIGLFIWDWPRGPPAMPARLAGLASPIARCLPSRWRASTR